MEIEIKEKDLWQENLIASMRTRPYTPLTFPARSRALILETGL
jgi:hypothetical protein